MYSFTVVGTFSGAPLAVVSGITDLALRDQGGVVTLYAAGRAGGGLLSLNVTTGISLNDYVTVPVNGVLSAPSRLGVITVNGYPSVILTGPSGTLIGGYRIDADGSLGAATVITGTPTTSVTAQATITMGATQFLYTAPQGTNAIVVGQISAAGAMSTLQSVSLGPVVAGRDISALTPVSVGTQSMLVATSDARDEIDIYAVATDGRLSLLTTFGILDGLWADAAAALSAVVVDGQTFLVLGATGSSSLTVLRLDATGTLTVVDHVIDTLDTRFDGVQAIATVTIAGRAYVLAGGADDGVNLFALMPDGRLVLLSTVLDALGLGMTNVTALTAQAAGTGIDVFVAGEGAGITRLRVELGTLAVPQTGTTAANTLTGGALGDQLFGGAGNDVLLGGGGRDILSDGEGSDTLTGGADADIFVMAPDGATDTITDFQLGVDRIDLSEWGRVYDLTGLVWLARANGFALSFASETLEVQTANGQPLTAANFVAADFFGLWHLTGVIPINVPPPPINGGNDLFSPTAVADILDGGEGYDTVDYANAAAAIIVDVLTPTASTGFAAGDVFLGIEAVLGSTWSDLMLGSAGSDVLQGMNGNDTLDGRAGNDTLFGGAGRDVLRAGAGARTLDGGTSVDTVDYTGAPGAVQVNLGTGAVGGAALGHVLVNIEHVIGSAFGDVLTGTTTAGQYYGGAGNDLIFGAGGNDLLSGDDGNDTLHAGQFAEILVGGSGYDIADFALSAQGLRLDLQNTANSTGFAYYDTYQQIEAFSATNHGDTLLGTAGADQLFGGNGDDMLAGRGGGDILSGDGGNDTVVASASADDLYGGAGFDAVDYSGATGAVLVDLRGALAQGWAAAGDALAGFEAVLGSAYDDVVYGSAASESLSGGAGGDILRGYGGSDTLLGGDGHDNIFGDTGAEVLAGGAGYDVLYYLDAAQGVLLDLTAPWANAGAAQGDVISGFEYFVGSAHNDTLRGSAATEQFFGGAGNDAFAGNGGNDGVYGEAGDDIFRPGLYAEFFVGGAGLDAVDFSLAASGFTLDLQNAAISTGAAYYDAYIEVEVFYASDFADTLRGGVGADWLFGLGGDDVLMGRGGGDKLFGGSGNDTLLASDSAETLDGGAGFDAVDYSGASGPLRISLAELAAGYGAPDGDILTGIEGVIGTAFGDTLIGWVNEDMLSGGGGGDYLTSDGGADMLSGGDGADTLMGGAGSDTLWGDNGADLLMGDDGIDFAAYRSTNGVGVAVDIGIWANNTGTVAGDIFSAIEGLLGTQFGDTLNGDNADNQLIGAAGQDVLLGRGGDDAIYGGDGNDTLTGSEGNDALFGGAGADATDGGAGFDIAYFDGPGAVIVDLVTPANNRNDAAGDTFLFVEGLSGSAMGDGFYGTGEANHFQGHSGDDALVGRAGNDTLIGGAGHDFVNGGAGLDQLYGGIGADRFVVGKGDGADVIYDFSLAQGDVLQFTKVLTGIAKTGQSVVQRFGSLSGGSAVLDFGNGDRVTLAGVTTLDGLALAIQII